jgi:transposase
MGLFPRGRWWKKWGFGGYIKPSYSPELNPAGQVFAEVRRWVEGRRYERIEAKKAAVEEGPRELEAGGGRFHRW